MILAVWVSWKIIVLNTAVGSFFIIILETLSKSDFLEDLNDETMFDISVSVLIFVLILTSFLEINGNIVAFIKCFQPLRYLKISPKDRYGI